MRSSVLAFAAAGAAAQNMSMEIPTSPVPSHPGGALPAGLTGPNTAGFGENPSVLPSRGGEAVCVSGIVPVTASAMNLKFNYEAPQNQTQVTETFLEYVTQGSPFMTKIMGGMQPVNGTYNIGATLCTPGNNTKPAGVQILTHGVGFDRTYWDFAPGYSYADLAAEYGYASFFYDRLATGVSSKPDGINVAQTPLELEILHKLVGMLKAGDFSGNAFTTVVGAGHSYGSLLTQGLTSKYPADLDAAVLTGFSVNTTGLPVFLQANSFQIASQNQPLRFSALNNTYLVASTFIANQAAFFRSPGFDPLVLQAAEATKGPVTIGQLFSQNAVMGMAPNFTAPIAVVDGAEDLPFCFGNCSYPTNHADQVFPMLYPNAMTHGSYLAPVTGHGLNLHYSAVTAYNWIQTFIQTNVK